MHEQLDILSGHFEEVQARKRAPAPPPADLAAAQQPLMTVEGLYPVPGGGLAREIRPHSLRKADRAFRYGDIVSKAMGDKFELWWLELQAGPGKLKLGDQILDGSALDALRIEPGYAGYVFADASEECVRSLHQLIGERDHVHIRRGNANDPEHLQRVCALIPSHALVVAYLDPEGLELHMATIRYLAWRFRRIDFLINFPVHAVDRNLSAGNCDDARQMLDHPNPQQLLAGAGTHEAIRSYYYAQLEAFGHRYRAGHEIRSEINNVSQYDLLLASRNPRAPELYDKATRNALGGQRGLEIAN